MFRTWLTRALGAPSFAEFWRYWNPVYGYYLYFYTYRPLRRFFPRPVAMWVTFVTCGFFLHDALGWALRRHVHVPEMTVRFTLFGAGAVLSDGVGMDLRRWPLLVRVLVNLTYLAGSWFAASMIVEAAT